MSQRPAFVVLTALLTVCAGCSEDNKESTATGVERILGNERLGWDQAAATAADLDKLKFFIAVDGVKSEMPDVQCATTPGAAGFACSGRLPAMSPGRHSLQLATAGPTGAESEWSAPFPVILSSSPSSSVAPSSSGAAIARVLTTADRVKLKLTTVVTGLNEATDLASLPDGRTLIAERRGEIREVRVEGPEAGQIRLLMTVPDVDTARQGGLLALAVDPAFERNRFVYAVYTASDGFRVVRFRDTGDRLEDRIVLLEHVPSKSSPPAAVLGFGPDAKLYVAFDDAGDARRAGDMGSFNGKVLRLNPDATTPSDQAGGTPVYVIDVNAPSGLAWTAVAGPLWIVQTSPDASRSGELRGVVRESAGGRGRVAMRYLLPPSTRPGRMVVYRGALLSAFAGDVFVAAGEGGGLLRIRIDATDALKVVSTERLFEDPAMAIRGVSIGRDGAMYLSTASALLRLMPNADPE